MIVYHLQRYCLLLVKWDKSFIIIIISIIIIIIIIKT